MAKYKPLTEINKKRVMKRVKAFYLIMKKYHSYSVFGLEKLSPKQNYIFVLNHSLATYDLFLFVGYLYFNTGIWARPILDDLIYKIPLLSQYVSSFGPIPDTLMDMKLALENKESILIAPGGIKESLRSSEEKYSICWDDKKNFVELSIETNTPIVLAACPFSDDIYDVKKSSVTDLLFERFDIPFPIAKGASKIFPFIPKRVELTHYLSDPFFPPKLDNTNERGEKIDDFHAILVAEMENLLGRYKDQDY